MRAREQERTTCVLDEIFCLQRSLFLVRRSFFLVVFVQLLEDEVGPMEEEDYQLEAEWIYDRVFGPKAPLCVRRKEFGVLYDAECTLERLQEEVEDLREAVERKEEEDAINPPPPPPPVAEGEKRQKTELETMQDEVAEKSQEIQAVQSRLDKLRQDALGQIMNVLMELHVHKHEVGE